MTRAGHGETTPSHPARRCRILKTLAAIFLLLCLGFLPAGCIYNTVAARRLEREINNTPRDPQTGIVVGVDALDLNPGSRHAVLLVHGFLGSPRDFGQLPDALAREGFRVRAPLLPGHGACPTDLENVTREDLFQAVRSEYARLRGECDTIAVVGLSMGGTLALRLVRDVSPQPDALVLASPHLRVAYRWYTLLPAETWSRLTSPFIPYLIKGRAFVMVNRREAIDELYSYNVIPHCAVRELDRLAADVRKNPPRCLPAETLVIYAPGDGASSASAIRKLCDDLGLPDERRLVLGRSNHHVYHDFEREEAIARTLAAVQAVAWDR